MSLQIGINGVLDYKCERCGKVFDRRLFFGPRGEDVCAKCDERHRRICNAIRELDLDVVHKIQEDTVYAVTSMIDVQGDKYLKWEKRRELIADIYREWGMK